MMILLHARLPGAPEKAGLHAGKAHPQAEGSWIRSSHPCCSASRQPGPGGLCTQRRTLLFCFPTSVSVLVISLL